MSADFLVHQDGKTFLRHDQIKVSQPHPGIVELEFLWRGVLTHTLREECSLTAGQTLTLAGVEGWTEIQGERQG